MTITRFWVAGSSMVRPRVSEFGRRPDHRQHGEVPSARFRLTNRTMAGCARTG
jgi:hypothetical protein